MDLLTSLVCSIVPSTPVRLPFKFYDSARRLPDMVRLAKLPKIWFSSLTILAPEPFVSFWPALSKISQ